MDDDVIACARLVERGDPDRFAAVMAAPVRARSVLFPLYAFNVEVARAPWVTEESMIAEMRLQWWRDALDEIGTGGVVRRHEVVTPLAHVLDKDGAKLLDQLITARQWDIYRDPFEDDAHFEGYLDQSSGNLLWAAVRALGGGDEAVVRDAGYALGLANWLRAIPALESAGRKPLVDGRSESVASLAHAGLSRLRRARRARGKITKPARPAMFALWQSGFVLARAARHPGLVAAGASERAPAMRSLGLTMRAMTRLW